jgi:hypothetical protein
MNTGRRSVEHVTTDDLLKAFPEIAPPRPAVGTQVQLSDAELITLAVMQALEGYISERRWLRHAHTHSAAPVPVPAGAVRVQQAPACRLVPGHLHDQGFGAGQRGVARRCVGAGLHPGGMRPLPGRGDALGPGRMAQYGYCASHSRYFRGLRLRLVCTLSGLPVAFALVGAKAGEQ